MFIQTYVYNVQLDSHNFKTSFGYFYAGPNARKSLDHAQTRRVSKNFAQFFGGWVPHGVD